MKLKPILIALGLLTTVCASLFASTPAEAQMTKRRHSAAWYRTHRVRRSTAMRRQAMRRASRMRHSSAWYRKHRRM